MATFQSPYQIYMLLSMMTSRLDDNNFIIWSYQLQTLLEGQDLFGYIDGNTLCPSKFVITDDEGVTNEITTAYKEWKKTDKAILSLLIATLSFDVMDYVVGSKTSREVWMRLNDRYATNSRSHVMQLKTDLYAITKGMESVEKYLMKVIRVRNQLAALGERMDDEDIVVVILSGLPAEFNLIKAIIRARETPIAISELRILLLAAERDIATRVVSQRSLNGNGNMFNDGGSYRYNFWSAPQCQICRKKDHTAVSCFYRNIVLFDQPSSSVLTCQICNMKGHAALECNSLGMNIGMSPNVVDRGEQTVVIDGGKHDMINIVSDESDSYEGEINIDGVCCDESDSSGRESNIDGICSVFGDISSIGSDESESSKREYKSSGRENIGNDESKCFGRENIGGVCSVTEDNSSTDSSIGAQYVDQVPRIIASSEAVVKNSVCSVVGGLKIKVEAINHDQVIQFSAVFLVILCSVHNFGTSKVGLAINPALRAFNPVHIYFFFKRNSTKALYFVESFLLCASGFEAMYTDLCYFAVPFVQLTVVCLVLSSLVWRYLGQEAYLMENPSGADQALLPSISNTAMNEEIISRKQGMCHRYDQVLCCERNYAKNSVHIAAMRVSSFFATPWLSHDQMLKNEGIACGIKGVSCATGFYKTLSFSASLISKVLSSILPISVC